MVLSVKAHRNRSSRNECRVASAHEVEMKSLPGSDEHPPLPPLVRTSSGHKRKHLESMSSLFTTNPYQEGRKRQTGLCVSYLIM